MRRWTLFVAVLAGVGLVSGVSLADHFDDDAGTGAFNPQYTVTVAQATSPMLVNRPTDITLNLTQADHEDPPTVARLRVPGDWNFAFSSTRQAETPAGVPTTNCNDAIDNRRNSPDGTGNPPNTDFSKRTDAKFTRAEKIGRVHLKVHADGVTRPGAPATWDGDIAFINYNSVTQTATLCALFISTDTRVISIPDPPPPNTEDDIEGITEIVAAFPVSLITDGGNQYWETLIDAVDDLAKDETFQTLNVSVTQLRSTFDKHSVGNWHPGGGLDFSRGSTVSGSKTFQGLFKTCPANDPAYGACKSGRPEVVRTSNFTFVLPAPAITAPAGGTLTNVNPVSVSGTSDPFASVQVFSGAAAAGSPATADAAGAWTASVPLADGSHTLTAKTVDAGGASPASNSRNITVDTTPPAAVNIGAPAESALVGGTSVAISGPAEATARVEIVEGATTIATVTSTGTFSTTVSLAKGPHAIMARAIDVAGNVGAFGPLRSFNVTTAAPIISVPAENSATKLTTVVLSGIAEPNAVVTLDEAGTPIGPVVASPTGAWSISHAFPEGPHQITATATADGFTSPVTAVRSFVVDLTAPDAPVITAPTPNQTVRSISVPVAGTMAPAEAGGSVAIFEGGTRLGTAVVNAAGNWNVTVVLPDGVHKIRAIATDRAGNTGPASPLLTFTVDDPLEINNPVAGSFNPGTIIATGGADPLATQIRLFEGLTELARVPSVDGAWTATLSLATGTHTIYARALNGGILGPSSPKVTFKVDATPPTVKIKKPQGYNFAGVTLDPVGGYATDAGPADSRLDRVEVTYVNLITGEEVTRAASCTGCNGGATATWTDGESVLPGLYRVTATSYDRVGNAATDTVLLIIL